MKVNQNSIYQNFQDESKQEIGEQVCARLFFTNDFYSVLRGDIFEFEKTYGVEGNQDGFSFAGCEQLQKVIEYITSLSANSGYYPIVSQNVFQYIRYLQDLDYSDSLTTPELDEIRERKFQLLKQLIRLDKNNQGNYHDRFYYQQIFKYARSFLEKMVQYSSFHKESELITFLSNDFFYTKSLLDISSHIKQLSSCLVEKNSIEKRKKQLQTTLFFDSGFLSYCQKLINENSVLLQEPAILDTIYYVLNANHTCMKYQPEMSELYLKDRFSDFQNKNEYLRSKILPMEFSRKH